MKMEQGDTAKLSAYLLSEKDCTLEWQSTNPEVAIVNQDGLVTAIAPGFAEIVAKVDSLLASCIVEVKKPIVPVTFDISISDITATSATVKVVPSDTKAYYYFDIINAENIREYESDSAMVQDYIDYYVEYIEEYNEYYGTDYSFFEEFISQGEDELEYEELTASTQFYAFAAVVDSASNKVKGKVFKVPFTTKDVEKVTFSIVATPSDTCVIFTPNNSSITFLYDYMDTDTLNAACQANELTQAEYFQAYMAYLEQMLVYYGATLSDMTISGPFYISYHDKYVTPGRPFTLMAQAYSGGVFNSDFVSVPFNIPQENGAPALKKGTFNKQQMLKKAKKINSFIGGKNTYQKR